MARRSKRRVSKRRVSKRGGRKVRKTLRKRRRKVRKSRKRHSGGSVFDSSIGAGAGAAAAIWAGSTILPAVATGVAVANAGRMVGSAVGVLCPARNWVNGPMTDEDDTVLYAPLIIFPMDRNWIGRPLGVNGTWTDTTFADGEFHPAWSDMRYKLNYVALRAEYSEKKSNWSMPKGFVDVGIIDSYDEGQPVLRAGEETFEIGCGPGQAWPMTPPEREVKIEELTTKIEGAMGWGTQNYSTKTLLEAAAISYSYLSLEELQKLINNADHSDLNINTSTPDGSEKSKIDLIKEMTNIRIGSAPTNAWSRLRARD